MEVHNFLLNARWVKEKLERMKELYKERNTLYEKQNDLKGQKQKWKLEKAAE